MAMKSSILIGMFTIVYLESNYGKSNWIYHSLFVVLLTRTLVQVDREGVTNGNSDSQTALNLSLSQSSSEDL